MDHKECVWVKYLLPKVCNGLKCRTVLALGLHQNTCQSNILKNKVVDREAQIWWGGSQTSQTSPFFSEASELTRKQQMWPELPKKAPLHPPSSSPSFQYPQTPIPAMMQPGITGNHLTLSETPWGAILPGVSSWPLRMTHWDKAYLSGPWGEDIVWSSRCRMLVMGQGGLVFWVLTIGFWRGWDGWAFLNTRTQNKGQKSCWGLCCGYYLANTQIFLAFQKFNLHHFAFKKDLH